MQQEFVVRGNETGESMVHIIHIITTVKNNQTLQLQSFCSYYEHYMHIITNEITLHVDNQP